MNKKELYIKNMVCPRCISAVEDILVKNKVETLHIELGKAIVVDNLTQEALKTISEDLARIGFELLNNSQQQLVEQIKNTIIESVYNYRDGDDELLSDMLVQKLNRDYSFISKLFSSTEGITIEHYAILQKTERVKELLSYDQLTLSQIAYTMGYSSVAHVSQQFKKMTGMTPTQFKSQSAIHRNAIDKL